MWREIGLLGRDKLLQREILPRATRKKAPFLLSGARGVGKSAILQWAHDHAPEPKAYLQASKPVKENLHEIIRAWGLSVEREGKAVSSDRATIAELERVVMAQTGGTLFVDDLDAATPAFLRRLKAWRERFTVHAAGVPPFSREELRRIIWGLKEVTVHPLPTNERDRLALAVCQHAASPSAPREIAQASRGYPARIWAMARGEIETTAPRVAGEEVDISPVLLLGLAGVVVTRFIGMSLDEADLYVLGGFGMAAAMVARFFLFRGMK